MDTEGSESIPIQPLNSSTPDEDTINLTLLLVSGERANVSASLTSSIIIVKQHIFENWPENFPDKPSQLFALRLVYLGKFLDDNSTLQSCKIIPGDNTIMHLNISKQPTGELRGVVPAKQSETAPKCSCIIQ